VARRSGLGKGLGALIPTEVARDRSATLREVPLASIRPNPLQPRTHFDEEAMASLASSIKEVGVLQPVLVRESGEGEYELIAGERRWRAARRAGLQTMPVLVQASSDVHSLEQALVENLHREDLNPLEEAAAYQQLVDTFDYTHEQVAARVGKSRTAVTNTLRLLQLPAGVQRALADGTMSAGHARALLGTPDRAFQEELARRTVAEGLTVRAVEELVRRHVQGADPGDDQVQPSTEVAGDGRRGAPARAPDPTTRRRLPAPGLVELEELLSAHLNTRVKVEMTSKRGRVVIDFATLEDLERIYKLMVGGSG
jgi:ParB family chromosome partitioning protein